MVVIVQDSCAEELSALAIAVSGDASNRSSGLLESLFQLLRAKDVQTQDAETNDTLVSVPSTFCVFLIATTLYP